MRTPFGEWLEHQIRQRDWTLRQAADHIGVEQSSVSRYINGVASPSRVNLKKIAQGLSADRDELEALVDAGRPRSTAGESLHFPNAQSAATLSGVDRDVLLQSFGQALAERLSPQALREIADIIEREQRE